MSIADTKCPHASKGSDLVGLARREAVMESEVCHPAYYGGKDNVYEAIKVIEAWGLGFNLGSVLKYIARAGKKTESPLKDLEKALFYVKREIELVKKGLK